MQLGKLKLSYANVMATLAVFIALGGTGYAISKLPKNSVRSKQIAKSAVKSSDIARGGVKSVDVADGALLGKDFKAGELPQGPPGEKGDKGDTGNTGAVGPTYGAAEATFNPVANPDQIFPTTAITTPAAGKLMVMLSITGPGQGVTVDCSAGNPTVGLYVDGTPVPGTREDLNDATSASVSRFGITATSLPAGHHTLGVGEDCAAGTVGTTNVAVTRSFGAILLGS